MKERPAGIQVQLVITVSCQGAKKQFGDISKEEEVAGFLWPAISWNKRRLMGCLFVVKLSSWLLGGEGVCGCHSKKFLT